MSASSRTDSEATRAHCSKCGSRALAWEAVSGRGRGRVHTFTVTHRAPHRNLPASFPSSLQSSNWRGAPTGHEPRRLRSGEDGGRRRRRGPLGSHRRLPSRLDPFHLTAFSARNHHPQYRNNHGPTTGNSRERRLGATHPRTRTNISWFPPPATRRAAVGYAR